jgi:AGCS family alanine or glycine:cation symporter
MMLEWLNNMITALNAIVWGPVMLVLILGTGLYLMGGLYLIPLRKLPRAFQLLWKGRDGAGEGEISPFNALMTSLSATIGTGNIAGVATAIFLGGPGALFWMWMTALVGMATKYSEAVLAVRYRETDDEGNHVGGPMYYIKNGLGKKWKWLGTLFAFFAVIAGFGIGNTVQSNSVADVMQATFNIPPLFTGAMLSILVFSVLIGGIRRIADVAGKIVPLMAVMYLGGGITILIMNASALPEAFNMIITHAFTPAAATGGFAGAAVWAAIRFGVARGIFSNEAGLGSAPIAHAAARTDSPVRQGLIAMLGTFIDTIVICSVTGLVIVTSGEWSSGLSGAALSSSAFEATLPGYGSYIVSLGLMLFAFTTLLGWSFYGEKSIQYLLGERAVIVFRIAWIAAIPLGAVAHLEFIWLVADTLNALMAIPNLIALILLSPVVFSLTRAFFQKNGGKC